MTMALEQERRRAEDTLTLLAAAESARDDLDARLAQALLRAEEAAAARAEAEAALDETGGTLDATRAALGQAQDRIRALEADLAQAVAARTGAEAEAMEAEDVRARLIAALAAQKTAEAQAAARLTEAERQAALLSEARAELAEQADVSDEAQRRQAALTSQVTALRRQLSELQALLDASQAREAEAELQIETLGDKLNSALTRVASEERRRRQAEQERARLLEAEAERLKAQNETLEKYRSEFFGRLRDLLGGQEGVKIVGDRFVFSSEVLFAPGEAELEAAGEREIAKVVRILRGVIDEIPDGIDWVLQVDGHTDDVPITQGELFADNWELSQARALSVVRYMVETLDFPPDRLSANGYGEYQPVNPADTPEGESPEPPDRAEAHDTVGRSGGQFARPGSGRSDARNEKAARRPVAGLRAAVRAVVTRP